MLRVRSFLVRKTSQISCTPYYITPSLAPRFYHASNILREEDEEDEETKAKRLQIEGLLKPHIHPSVIPRRRRGLTVETFLEKIGKECGEHKDKIKTWEELFTLKSLALKKLEIPIKQRRWILRWTEKYRQGITPGYEKK